MASMTWHRLLLALSSVEQPTALSMDTKAGSLQQMFFFSRPPLLHALSVLRRCRLTNEGRQVVRRTYLRNNDGFVATVSDHCGGSFRRPRSLFSVDGGGWAGGCWPPLSYCIFIDIATFRNVASTRDGIMETSSSESDDDVMMVLLRIACKHAVDVQ